MGLFNMKTAISLVLFILILNSCRGSRPEPEIYLIPTSYRGKVNVIFNQAKGQEIMYEGDKRVYRIPENGILLTKAKPEYGFIRHEYHFVDSSGKRTLIKYYLIIMRTQKKLVSIEMVLSEYMETVMIFKT
ncbi:DUF6843 domain-containing protein [Chryseobacterium arachidis]|uniref:DUF6843 domain-containing protein n=1 Tax=Chryseobacterium arachidis TaxID=1416778 RepID=UPI00360C06D9